MRHLLENVVEEIKIQNSVSFPDNRALYEIIWKNAVQPDIPQMTILGRMPITSSITKVTHTHTEYVIFNAFQLQQWLNKRASTLRYTYMVCLVFYGRRHNERIRSSS
jgi:hypothetical protein